MVATIYSYIQLSDRHLKEFKDMAEQLEVDAVKFKPLFEVRWLSLGDSVDAIIRNYKPLLAVLSEAGKYGDPTAIGLLQQLKSYKMCALLNLVADILYQTNSLSKLFQRRDVCFSVIKSNVSTLYTQHNR